MECRKMILKNLFGAQQWRSKYTECREQSFEHGERGGEGEMHGKSNMETYIIVCKIDSHGNLLYGSGNSNRGSVST